jgi:16S rRNA (cytosine1402-N4)-methyltransferase|tara:strand:+ start:8033 stop:8947 length:915 start_codon:yes stop_codon:yes gene_type:complete
MNENRVGYLEHEGVMLAEVNSVISSSPSGLFIDATYGYGSHFRSIENNFSELDLLAFDRDVDVLNESNSQIIQLNFSQISEYLIQNNIDSISGILYDFGVSSHQLDNHSRGFSYSNDGPLDMRMNQNDEINAFEVVNKFDENEIADILFQNSGEKKSRRIAKDIVSSRPIESTQELVNVIKNSIGKQNPKYISQTIKRCFQSFRIHVNDEFNEIQQSLNNIKNFVKANGVIICITYHSLEDKIVKKIFTELTTSCYCDVSIPVCTCENEQLYTYGEKKKIYPSDVEISKNSRASSATLRYVIKL